MHIKAVRSLKRTVEITCDFNKAGIACSITHLPTFARSTGDVVREMFQYGRILAAIADNKLSSDITVKLRPFGLHIDNALAFESVHRLVAGAAEQSTFVWLDMELPETVDATIDFFKRIRHEYPNCGICLQAYLDRTDNDAAGLLRDRVPLRLVKGFYRKHDIVPWRDVSRNYEKLMRLVLNESAYPAIATHDLELIATAKRLIRQFNIERAEFQFFYGLRNELARELARDGFRVRIFIPYGNVCRFLLDGFSTFDIWHQAQRALGLTPQL